MRKSVSVLRAGRPSRQPSASLLSPFPCLRLRRQHPLTHHHSLAASYQPPAHDLPRPDAAVHAPSPIPSPVAPFSLSLDVLSTAMKRLSPVVQTPKLPQADSALGWVRYTPSETLSGRTRARRRRCCRSRRRAPAPATARPHRPSEARAPAHAARRASAERSARVCTCTFP